MIGVRAEVRELFFDRATVHRAIDETTRAMMTKFGSFTRRTAQQSIRSRKKASDPGKPPSNRTGLLRDNIFLAYDPKAHSVVVGPVYLGGITAAKAAPGETVPSVLERGGTVTRKIITKGGKHQVGGWGTIAVGGKGGAIRKRVRKTSPWGDFKGTAVVRVKLTTQRMVDRADRLEEELAQTNVDAFGGKNEIKVTIGPRPFMVPAFNKELGVLDTLWQSAK